MNLVFVHGILDNGSIFDKMIAFFEQHGIPCYAPSLTPSDGRTGLDELANQLKRHIDSELAPDRPISIIGFSMGAMIARFYLQRLGGFKITRQFFSISAPHKGSVWSYFYPGKGTKQMRPGSPFLQELDNSVDCLQGMNIYSYWTPFDLVIIPPSSSQWEIAHNIKINALCHPCMLRNTRLIANIHDKLTEISL
jgi:triacylglycerol lipase